MPSPPDPSRAAEPDRALDRASEAGTQLAADDGKGPAGESGAEKVDQAQLLFAEFLAEARRGFDPKLVVQIAADTFERVLPQLYEPVRERLTRQLEAKTMNPEMKQMMLQMNEAVLRQAFARVATVLRSPELNKLRGIAEPTAGATPEAAEAEHDARP